MYQFSQLPERKVLSVALCCGAVLLLTAITAAAVLLLMSLREREMEQRGLLTAAAVETILAESPPVPAEALDLLFTEIPYILRVTLSDNRGAELYRYSRARSGEEKAFFLRYYEMRQSLRRGGETVGTAAITMEYDALPAAACRGLTIAATMAFLILFLMIHVFRRLVDRLHPPYCPWRRPSEKYGTRRITRSGSPYPPTEKRKNSSADSTRWLSRWKSGKWSTSRPSGP